MKKGISVLICLAIGMSSYEQSLTSYVDPFIGTAAHGHTYPGATVPFGMVQLSPDNGRSGWDWCSGYHYSDSVIVGFSHTHLSGTGIGDLLDISVMPSVNQAPDTAKISSNFSHVSEIAMPGYYKVSLLKYGIKAELTTGLRYGIQRYTFPASKNAMIKFDLGFALNWDKATDTYFKQIDDSTFVGYRFSTGWAKDQKVYFAARISKPVKQISLFADGQKTPTSEAKAKKIIACLSFPTTGNEAVELKVALSFANIEGALAGLKSASGMNFDKTRIAAQQLWENELSKIKIATKDARLRKIFYTSLYHSFMAPTVFNDAAGNYKSTDGELKNSNSPVYSTHSIWDVFRAETPLFTIVQTNRMTDVINSYLDFYKQSGLLPVWDLAFNETNCMTGYHAVPVVADAILKGVKGFNVPYAYEAMKKSAMQNIRGTDVYRQYGYIPQDKYGSSVTVTLEYAYDDWCIAQVAKKLGNESDYKTFMKRSESWKPLFDTTIGFARAKNSDGKWVLPFDPYYSEHDADKAMFTEGNAWQHSWFVPQDVKGLIAAYGGEKKFIGKLDSLFTASSALAGENVSPDISGLIGQYVQGNEPDHHVPYLYSLAGVPAKTAEKVDQIMKEMYTDKPDGLSGNEDCGQMSAWYVFSAMGFYPVNPAGGNFVFGRPLFDKTTIALPNGKKFSLQTINNSTEHIYIQSITLNGKAYSKSFITYADIMKGGALVIKMGVKPSDSFGVKPVDRAL